jgi:hypothetical protein
LCYNCFAVYALCEISGIPKDDLTPTTPEETKTASKLLAEVMKKELFPDSGIMNRLDNYQIYAFWGNRRTFGAIGCSGYIKVINGSPTDYMVTMAIRSHLDNSVYAPKPSDSQPKVTITPGDKPDIGYFTCVFAMYGSDDVFSPELHIYVINSEFVPGRDLERTKNESVAYEIITRS